eukprot:4999656-Prymnesium_polylepis.1
MLRTAATAAIVGLMVAHGHSERLRVAAAVEALVGAQLDDQLPRQGARRGFNILDVAQRPLPERVLRTDALWRPRSDDGALAYAQAELPHCVARLIVEPRRHRGRRRLMKSIIRREQQLVDGVDARLLPAARRRKADARDPRDGQVGRQQRAQRGGVRHEERLQVRLVLRRNHLRQQLGDGDAG